MAASNRRAQESVRAHGSSKCSKHYSKEVIYVCENCDVLACVDCAIQQHKGHELEGLSNVVPGAKQKLQDFVKRVEETEIPRIKEKFKKVDSDLSNNKKHFKKQVSEIKKRTKTLKKELDKIAETLVKTCLDMEHQNLDTLFNHQEELQTQLDKLSFKIQEVKATIQSGSDVLLYDTSHVIPSESEDLLTPSCNTAEFNLGQLPLQQLEQLLGEVNITDYYQPKPSLSQPANWRVMSEFTPYKEDYAPSMHAEGEKAWLSYFGKKKLSVNQKGKLQQTLHLDTLVKDFCLSPETGNIWHCSVWDNSVREVKDKRDQVKFTKARSPLCICVTRDDHVLVGNNCQIVKYTQTGKMVCTTSGGTPPVVRKPYRMSECPLTQHVAVVDQNWSDCGGNGKPFVSILNDQLQFLHNYKGEVSGQQPSASPFDPSDVCYTDAGDFVLADCNNRSVVLVTGTGKYLQTLYTDSESGPLAVSVHSGALWVSLANGKIKVLKDN